MRPTGDRDDRSGGQSSKLVSSFGERGDVVALLSPTVRVAAPVLTSRPFGKSGLLRWSAAGELLARGETGVRTIRVTAREERPEDRPSDRSPALSLHRHAVIRIEHGASCRLTQAVDAVVVAEVLARVERLLALVSEPADR